MLHYIQLFVFFIFFDGFNGSNMYGIMVTRSDHWVIQTWLHYYAPVFHQLALLDGTVNISHRKMIKNATLQYPNVIYAHESQFLNVSYKKTDNGLRGIAFSLLDQENVIGKWVVIAHPDEFYPQSFLKLSIEADKKNSNIIGFKVWYAVPYFDDSATLEDGIEHGPKVFNILQRVRYCFSPSAYRFSEIRMYKHISKEIKWGSMHKSTIPQYFPGKKGASFQGYYVHYKVHSFEPNEINEKTGEFSNSVWSGIPKNELRNIATNGKVGIYSILKSGEGHQCSTIVIDFCTSNPLILCDVNLKKMFLSEENNKTEIV